MDRTAVVIPVFGREDVFTSVAFLRRCPYAGDLRFVIIDNGNDAALAGRLATLAGSDCRVVRLPVNLGGSGAYAAGMRAAMEDPETRYLWLLDDDAMPNEKTLPGLFSVFQEDVNDTRRKPIGVVGSAMLGKLNPFRVNEVGAVKCRFHPCFRLRFNQKDIRKLGERVDEVDYVAAASVLVSREVVEKVGVFEEVFIHWDDIDWCYRVREAGYRVMATTRSTINHPEDTGKASEWIIYYDVRNSLWFAKRHFSFLSLLHMRYGIWKGRLWCVYHGKRASIRMIDLGVAHARTGELLLRKDLPLTPCPRTIAELVNGSDCVGILARPKEVGDAMDKAVRAAGAKNVHTIICRRPNTNKVWKYVLAFAAQIRLQFAIWRAKRPVVFQDSFCVGRYPLRITGAEKHFFAAANGKAEILPE